MENIEQRDRTRNVGAGERGEIEITEERTMVELSRKNGRECLRLQFVKAIVNGRDTAWHSLRVFWRDDQGNWKPGKAGITIRGSELRAVTEGLLKATGGGRPSP